MIGRDLEGGCPDVIKVLSLEGLRYTTNNMTQDT
jgi:hypothetical protein